MAATSARWVPPELAIDAATVATAIEGFISQQRLVHQRDGAVLGLSGCVDYADDVDSALG